MAHSHSASVSHTHTRPGSKCCNLRDQPKHASQQPYQDKLDVRHTSSHIPASGAVATNGNPPPSSPRMPPSAEDVTGTQPDAILPAGPDDSSKSGDNNASALQNALSRAEIVKMLLTPPKSDTESSTAKHHKFHSSRSYLRSEIKRARSIRSHQTRPRSASASLTSIVTSPTTDSRPPAKCKSAVAAVMASRLAAHPMILVLEHSLAILVLARTSRTMQTTQTALMVPTTRTTQTPQMPTRTTQTTAV
jgi:hypothetical protein